MQHPPKDVVGSASTAAFLATKGTYLRYLSHFFFFPRESPAWRAFRPRIAPRMHDTCKKSGRSGFGGRVYSAIGRRWEGGGRYQKITETRMKGRLCDTYPEFERTIARTSLIPFPRTTGNYPATEVGTRRAPLSFILRFFLSLSLFFFLSYAA